MAFSWVTLLYNFAVLALVIYRIISNELSLFIVFKKYVAHHRLFALILIFKNFALELSLSLGLSGSSWNQAGEHWLSPAESVTLEAQVTCRFCPFLRGTGCVFPLTSCVYEDSSFPELGRCHWADLVPVYVKGFCCFQPLSISSFVGSYSVFKENF